MKKKTWKVVRAFQNNGPDYFLVTDRAFFGTVLAACPDISTANGIAVTANGNEIGALELLRRGLECGVFDDAPVFKRDVCKLLKR